MLQKEAEEEGGFGEGGVVAWKQSTVSFKSVGKRSWWYSK